jgi:hypothetical protein
MQRYKVAGSRPVLDAEPGKEVEAELSPEEEAAHLAARRLEIVPRPYKVVGPRRVHDTEPGEVFLAALTVGQEKSLIDAGHIERAPRTEQRKKEAKKVMKEESDG